MHIPDKVHTVHICTIKECQEKLLNTDFVILLHKLRSNSHANSSPNFHYNI